MTTLEQREKRGRISALLDAKDLDAIVLKKGANVAWIIGGRAHVPTTLELSCLDVIVYRDRIVVVTNKIEAPRLLEEELTGDEEIIVINWFEGREAQLPKGARIGVDVPEIDRVNVAKEIEVLRRNLNEFELARFRKLGSDCSAALGEAMMDLEPGMSEISAILKRVLLEMNGLSIIKAVLPDICHVISLHTKRRIRLLALTMRLPGILQPKA
jgi:Xaa-Pro aminopeptidase